MEEFTGKKCLTFSDNHTITRSLLLDPEAMICSYIDQTLMLRFSPIWTFSRHTTTGTKQLMQQRSSVPNSAKVHNLDIQYIGSHLTECAWTKGCWNIQISEALLFVYKAAHFTYWKYHYYGGPDNWSLDDFLLDQYHSLQPKILTFTGCILQMQYTQDNGMLQCAKLYCLEKGLGLKRFFSHQLRVNCARQGANWCHLWQQTFLRYRPSFEYAFVFVSLSTTLNLSICCGVKTENEVCIN